MELVNYNEIYGEFSVLKSKGDIDEAVLAEAAEYFTKRLKLNYKDLYASDVFLSVYHNNDGYICQDKDCTACLKDKIVLDCTMCNKELSSAPKGQYSIIDDKLEISEVKIPVCEDCYEKHKLFPVGAVSSFINESLKNYITNLNKFHGTSFNELELFLVC